MHLSEQTRQLLLWAIFALTYTGIAFGGFPRLVLDRTGVAILGAIAVLGAGELTIRQAAASIDMETMLLLFGLMIFSAQLRVAGFYVWTGRFLVGLIDRPRLLLAGLIAVSALLSALLANDIVCLAFTPLLCTALLPARRDPIPFLMALATASNIGSAATLIGNPQNMYIGTVARLPFGHFALTMLAPVAVALGLCWLAIVLLYRQRLHAVLPPQTSAIQAAEAHDGETLVPSSLPLQTHIPQREPWLIAKTLSLLAVLVGFYLFLSGPDAAAHRAVVTLAGAGVLLCSHRAKAARLYQLVDWNLILLFLGLFVVNGAMKQRGLTAQLFSAVTAGGLDLSAPWTLSGVTLVLSNLVSNVPAVLLLQPSVQGTSVALGGHGPWYLLALVSTWAGNLTLVGSIANLIVAESAAAFGVKLDLRTYCKAGIPLTLATVALGTLWVVLVAW